MSLNIRSLFPPASQSVALQTNGSACMTACDTPAVCACWNNDAVQMAAMLRSLPS